MGGRFGDREGQEATGRVQILSTFRGDQGGVLMSIFTDPMKAANWLRKCEADKYRSDWARYERQHPDEPDDDWNDCEDCEKETHVSQMEDGICEPCWELREKEE